MAVTTDGREMIAKKLKNALLNPSTGICKVTVFDNSVTQIAQDATVVFTNNGTSVDLVGSALQFEIDAGDNVKFYTVSSSHPDYNDEAFARNTTVSDSGGTNYPQGGKFVVEDFTFEVGS